MTLSTSSAGKILGVFAKQPIVGSVKTRLAQATSCEWATRVAQAFLEDTLDRLADIAVTRAIVYTPATATGFFSQMGRHRYDLIAQSDGDLGRRLRGFFDQARHQGFGRIIAVGSDSPTLPLAYVEKAFRLLETHDVVLGPALDGGYYLIGSGPKEIPLFDDIPWSTSSVLEKTVERVREISASLALLSPWYDVDSVDDWAMLRGHVLAMWQAGVDPQVPRVERLIQEQTP